MKVLVSSPVILLFLCPTPAAAQQPAGFGKRPTHELVLPALTDADVTRLIDTLDAVLPGDETPEHWARLAKVPLWDFARRLQDGKLSAAQEARVVARLDQLERQHPEAADAISRTRLMVTSLTIGKEAPDIAGTGLDGQPLRLSDYRGKVVVLKFGGAWCGICRTDYPYERFLLELYAEWPFAIVGVDSSDTPDEAKQGRINHGLTYRAWWDGRSGPDEQGPIAAEWNVLGWPAAYVIDADGIIRFVDLRGEDLLKGVRQLMVEHQRQTLQAAAGASR